MGSDYRVCLGGRRGCLGGDGGRQGGGSGLLEEGGLGLQERGGSHLGGGGGGWELRRRLRQRQACRGKRLRDPSSPARKKNSREKIDVDPNLIF